MAAYDPPGKILLTHSPHGLRVEVAVAEETRVELWISPLPTASRDALDRNFSNRDDHLRLWDAITLPGLDEAGFERCDYDPFHLTLYFSGGRTLEIVPLALWPGVTLWSGQRQRVVLKSDRAARAVERSPRVFQVSQTERGRDFTFGAHVGAPDRWQHPSTTEPARSQYAWTELSPGTPLVISGAITPEYRPDLASHLAAQPPAAIREQNEAKLAGLLAPGHLIVAPELDWQHLLDVNRRILIAMQDPMGAIRAALNRIYYLIWVRDGSIITVQAARAGNLAPLEEWTRFLLANPTRIDAEEPRGRAFLMLVSQTTKWEEDGWFYAVWATFTAWTQSGNAEFASAGTIETLAAAGDWLERRCHDAGRGAYGRYFCGETPLPGSRDANWDMAVGKPQPTPEVAWDGRVVRRSYDLYINALNWSAWRMLAAMAGPAEGPRWTAKARALEPFLKELADGPGLPAYGELLFADDSRGRCPAGGLDPCDYEWSLSLPPWDWAPHRSARWRRALLQELREKPAGRFLAGYFSVLAALDPLDVPANEIVAALEHVMHQCRRPGAKLPMPDTMIEMLDVPDGDLWHDIRPQAFSIGPFLAAVANLGVRRLPFGLAVRGSRHLKSIGHFRWQGQDLHFQFTGGEGPWAEVAAGGQSLPAHTLQLPEQWIARLTPGTPLVVRGLDRPPPHPVWTASNVRLESITREGAAVVFAFESFGDAWIELREAGAANLRVDGTDQQPLEPSRHTVDGVLHLMFPLHGAGTLRLALPTP